jgi:oleate hydratase
MPHANTHAELPHRNPEQVNAYLVGGGISSLAAAVHLIQDAHVPASQIHILESSPIPGGSMDGSGSPKTGYILRGGRMLNFSYGCTYKLLSKVPSLTLPGKTVKEELDAFNAVPGNKTHAKARLVATLQVEEGKQAEGKVKEIPVIMDVSKMGFHTQDRKDLLYVAAASEKTLGEKRIDECFRKEFFNTEFWYMWDTT